MQPVGDVARLTVSVNRAFFARSGVLERQPFSRELLPFPQRAEF